LARAEREARAARRGLWRQPNATPPWELRQGGCVRCEHGIFTIEGPIVAPEAPAEPNEVGFGVVHATGLHLELMLNWLSAQPKLDRLQRCWNRPWAVPLIRLLLAAGGLASRYALDLVYVARARP
jgi:hypothetical protein